MTTPKEKKIKTRERMRKWRAKNPEKTREKHRLAARKHRAAHPGQNYDRVRQHRMKHLLGERHYLDVYQELLEIQEGRCGICNKHHTEFNKRFSIDHCHKTNRIRGLLCYSCNTKLGFVEKYIKAIAEYLRKSKQYDL